MLASRAIHRHYLDTTRTYFSDGRHTIDELPTLADGTADLDALEAALAEPGRPVAGVMLGQPNAFGVLEPMARAAALAHAAGALFVSVVEPVSLAVLASPGEVGADIAVGEGQPLGIAPQYGGPYLGILAATEALTRQVPGRLVGRTLDVDGRRALMTLRARAHYSLAVCIAIGYTGGVANEITDGGHDNESREQGKEGPRVLDLRGRTSGERGMKAIAQWRSGLKIVRSGPLRTSEHFSTNWRGHKEK